VARLVLIYLRSLAELFASGLSMSVSCGSLCDILVNTTIKAPFMKIDPVGKWWLGFVTEYVPAVLYNICEPSMNELISFPVRWNSRDTFDYKVRVNDWWPFWGSSTAYQHTVAQSSIFILPKPFRISWHACCSRTKRHHNKNKVVRKMLLRCSFILYTDVSDTCANNPCKNGATCVDLQNSYRCDCKSGYTGGLCETGKILEFYLINKFNPLFGKPKNGNPNRKATSNNH